MAILTWESYSSLHTVITDETNFTKKEAIAEKEVSRVIGPLRWADLLEMDLTTEFFYGQQCDCIAKVIDYDATAATKAGKGVTSVSNDGYSESYAIQSESAAQDERASNIKRWLSGTGLVGAY